MEVRRVTLYFLDSRGAKRLVQTNVEPETAMSEITNYIKTINPNYKIYYYRTWYSEKDNGTLYDVGSHTEFFLLSKEDN